METLNDIAGYEEEKQELLAIIDMFKNYEKYSEKGAYISKGLILSGSPGVGKTLFAKVLANEIGAPFFHVDGSLLKGVSGVRKLKKIFKRAQKVAPSVIFIDELNTFVGEDDYSSDETRRNLSVLLKLIDGIDRGNGIFVIGASSDRDELDSALLRSGRMDKHICLEYPNFSSRMDIFNYYLSRVEMDMSGVNKKFVVEKMQGLNGADIKTLVNETALECFYRGTKPTNEMFILNIQKIEEQDIVRKNEGDSSYVAYHDIGHLVVCRELLKTYDDISIEYESSRLGNTSIISLFANVEDDDDEEEEQSQFETVSLALKKIAVLLGGIAAEEIMLSERCTGGSNDLRMAVNYVGYLLDEGMFGFDYMLLCTKGRAQPILSEQRVLKIEEKTEEILKEQFEVAKNIIRAMQPKIKILYENLIKNKVLSKDEVEKLLAKA